MSNKKKSYALIILDGWGYCPESKSNAITEANTPFWEHLWSNYPHTLLECSGDKVGLPKGQMGNSEVGHLNLGAGRVVYQDLTRISKDITEGKLSQHKTLLKSLSDATKRKANVHLMGLLSPGGVHSHEDHFEAFIELALKHSDNQIYLHAFLDGRDTPPKSAKTSLKELDDLLRNSKRGRIASVVGRYYAMDRDQRWSRIQQAYDLLVKGEASFHADDALNALEQAYQRNESDEFVQASSICDSENDAVKIDESDLIIFMNFRADRAKQLTRAFVDKALQEIDRNSIHNNNYFLTLTDYGITGPLCLYPPQILTNTLGEYLSKQNKSQLRIAETEKYAHVTYFFSGGIDHVYANEDRKLIPSPKVATYDLQPEMSAKELSNQLVEAIMSQQYDLIVCNYANGDMVGHTGNMEAAIAAAETIDKSLQQVIAALQKNNAEALITADHGNLEQMLDEQTGEAKTAHTCSPVPLILVGRNNKLKKRGVLSDVAPTLLDMMGDEAPVEMTGQSLLKED